MKTNQEEPLQPSLEGRYGIGEWFGRSFHNLSTDERLTLANASTQRSRSIKAVEMPCPPRSTPGNLVTCNKKSGVCSVRLYQRTKGRRGKDAASPGSTQLAPPPTGTLRTLCPNRFGETRTEDRRHIEFGAIVRWISQEMLGVADPLVVNEVDFLKRVRRNAAPVPPPSGDEAEDGREDVGKIDLVLVHPTLNPLEWCALEIQAVYFSGKSMGEEFSAIRAAGPMATGLPYPAANHRPDYRSSAPKRLMPQLQIKVPSLRRWGKKMAVLVDEDFMNETAPMATVDDISNCDIVWFAVRYLERPGEDAILVPAPGYPIYTTLDEAVDGLTAGTPVSKRKFEERILTTIQRRGRARGVIDSMPDPD